MLNIASAAVGLESPFRSIDESREEVSALIHERKKDEEKEIKKETDREEKRKGMKES